MKISIKEGSAGQPEVFSSYAAFFGCADWSDGDIEDVVNLPVGKSMTLLRRCEKPLIITKEEGLKTPNRRVDDTRLFLTRKQVAKYQALVRLWGQSSLPLCEAPYMGNAQQPGDYCIVDYEIDADEIGMWYGDRKGDKAGRIYIMILPDGSSHS